jgi:hypothetical protein
MRARMVCMRSGISNEFDVWMYQIKPVRRERQRLKK